MLGKQKCRMLKEIRQRIADENDIPYVTRECGFQGECKGTCPRCESELRYLERQLSLRASLGKRVTVAALCAGMSFAAVGCAPLGGKDAPGAETELSGAVAYVEPEPSEEPGTYVETGEVAWPEDEDEIAEAPEVLEETVEPVESDLMGDVAYFPEEEGNG